VNARALPVRTGGVPSPMDQTALVNADARHSASAALAAITATAVAASTAPVRDFIEDLAGMLPIRLTVHQREVLEMALTRAVDAIVLQRAG